MRQISVLLAEECSSDSERIYGMLCEASEFSYRLFNVSGIGEVFPFLQNNSIDVLIVDVSSMNFRGIEVFLHIQRSFSRVAVIALSRISVNRTDLPIIEAYIQDYLLKEELTSSLLQKSIFYSIARKKTDEDVWFQRMVLKNVRDAIIVMDLNGVITYWNEGASVLFGYAEEEALGSTVNFLDETKFSVDLVERYIRKIMSGVPYKGEWIGKRKDGTIIHLEVVAQPLYDFSGTLKGVIGVSRSMEERKKAEEKIRQSESNLRAFFNSINQSFLLFDRYYQILAFNNIAYRYFQKVYKHNISEKENLLDILSKEEKRQFISDCEKVLAGKYIQKEQKILFPDGEQKWFEITFSPVTDKGNMVFAISLTSSDITQKAQYQDVILKKNKELEKINFELDYFVYRASHDLKAPLSAILGITNVALIDPEASNKEVYFKMIERDIRKLIGVIKDITHFSRNARNEIEVDEIHYDDLIKETLSSLDYLSNYNRVYFQVQGEERCPFFSDRNRTKVLLNNLIANAIIFHDPKSETPLVRIYYKVEKSFSEVKIEDNGIGISEDLHRKIFQMFFRGSAYSIGSGLGLYIVKEIVNKLEGEIIFESEPGKGTCIGFRLPNIDAHG